MNVLEVFADIACPFTHVGVARFVAYRATRGKTEPLLHVRAWPLEIVNGAPFDGPSLAPKVAALRGEVAPDLFAGFEPATFPATTLPALAAAAAYRAGPEVGERFSLAVRHALFEEGLDIADAAVLGRLRSEHGVHETGPADDASVHHDHSDGLRRGVTGSPHFFLPDGESFFCPALDIERHGAASSSTRPASSGSSPPCSPEDEAPLRRRETGATTRSAVP